MRHCTIQLSIPILSVPGSLPRPGHMGIGYIWAYMGMYGHWATFNSDFGVLLLLALWPDLSSYIANDN